MLIAIDFDGTIVKQGDTDYDDLATPLQLMPGALEGLKALKKAGHVLLLWSNRASLALRRDWRLNPLWRSGAVPVNLKRWESSLLVNEGRYLQMIAFVEKELPGIFDALEDGTGGKPIVDIFLDDKAYRTIGVVGFDWYSVIEAWGEPSYE